MYKDMDTLWRTAIARNPNAWMVHYNLGHALLERGQVQEAIAEFERTLELKPDHAKAHYNLGVALVKQNRWEEALTHFQRSVELHPGVADTQFGLAQALVQSGRLDEAIVHYERALVLEPANPQAHSFLAHVLVQKGRVREAIQHYEAAVNAQPGNPFTLNNLAWMLATCSDTSLRNGPKAVTLAERANQLSGETDAHLLETLAAAYAETGRFEEAAATAQRGLEVAQGQHNDGLAQLLHERIVVYRQRAVPPKTEHPGSPIQH
jgi:tetratricopeptide (TPR) repeat protein